MLHGTLQQAKLQWYADNQRLLDANDALVAQQADTIRRLEAALAAAGGPAGRAAAARVKELEAQVGAAGELHALHDC